jgi:uncharacterized membrane protein YjjP (DUF1212 family)
MDGKMTTAELISAAIEIGQQLLECGAEIYRVEESMYRICVAYGAEDTHVYAVPTSIIATVARPGEEPVTRTRRIFHRGNDLDRLDRLNSLSRELCREPQDYETVMARLAEIDAAPTYGKWALVLAFGGITGFFTLLFGGGFAGAGVAFFIGLILKLVLDALERVRVNSLFINIVGGAVIACLAVLSKELGLIAAYDKVIIGSIMTLVPGLAITNSMRDLIAGDFIAGVTKFAEALMVAAGIAAGVAVPLALSRFLWGG